MTHELRARVGRLLAGGSLAILLSGVGVTPSLAAAARSPGCQSWNALGVSGWTSSVETIPGPFRKGETLRYRIDDNSIGDAFYLLTTGDEFLFTTTTTGAKKLVLPKDVAEISFNGTGSPPAIWYLSHFSCTAVGAQAPNTATIDAPAAPRQDARDVIALAALLAIAAGYLFLASRPRATPVTGGRSERR